MVGFDTDEDALKTRPKIIKFGCRIGNGNGMRELGGKKVNEGKGYGEKSK